MTQHDYSFQAQGRSRAAMLTLAVLYAAMLWAYLQFDAAPLVLAVIGAFSLPALWDVVSNRPSGMTLTDAAVYWHSGPRSGEIAWDQIAYARLDTRLDFSVRLAFVLHSGRRIRVPFEATPPHETVEAKLIARGLKVERHHFSLLG